MAWSARAVGVARSVVCAERRPDTSRELVDRLRELADCFERAVLAPARDIWDALPVDVEPDSRADDERDGIDNYLRLRTREALVVDAECVSRLVDQRAQPGVRWGFRVDDYPTDTTRNNRRVSAGSCPPATSRFLTGIGAKMRIADSPLRTQ